jgi:hypothetical protein
MKGLAITATFLASMAVVATAKPVPVSKMNPLGDLNPPLTRNDVDINSGPAGAMLEREYFQVPPPFTAGGLPCRLQSAIFNKVQLAQLCRNR